MALAIGNIILFRFCIFILSIYIYRSYKKETPFYKEKRRMKIYKDDFYSNLVGIFLNYKQNNTIIIYLHTTVS